ncbi:sensor histidine kinase [Yinghuangia seranimata]|uniref:sensor histidine kinase n=1 Tax=Yinghuangia seranimata TaxID=408067 RepID=UPI00248BBA5A|nr:nitrate- and nitrite sensing domain-containing protein [Yinghuangia seranimata]MDI2130419.1 nitrate- and nitrite sensing domain-containing protein [Yinghuangia seranimata]
MRKNLLPASIRGRLVAVLAVSLSAVLVLLGVLGAGELGAYRDAERTASDVGLALDVQRAVHELQRERGLTSGLLAGQSGYRGPLDAQRQDTDRALAAFAAATRDRDTAALRDAREHWARLARTRAQVDAGEAQRDTTFAYFTDGIAGLIRAGTAPERTRDRELLRGTAALSALGDAKEATAQARGFLNGVLSAGRFKNDEYQSFAEMRAEKQAGIAQFQRSATPAQQERADAALRSPAAVQAQRIEQTALGAADGRALAGLDAPTWWASMTTVIDAIRAVQLSLGDELRARAGELRDQAETRLLGYLAAAVLLVLGEIVLTAFAVRSITRPLTRLAAEAEALASTRLPEVITRLRVGEHAPAPPAAVPVRRGAGREIRAVAKAFGKVQDTAVQLASEQAVLRRNTTDSLVNLARRNQNLVRRQLGFISRLEHEETDPNALGNLFELDHLATRMRRNAESLLVLVGEPAPRPSRAPMHVSDVVRAALSEVEDYRRVVLRRMDDTAVVGQAVAELAHLVAELVENALAFSPPDVEVEIYGRRIGNDYLVAVIDHGVGMTAAALDAANARLSGEVDFLDAPSRSLGHHVVGRLARRLGADVRVGESPVAGVTARVLLPAAVLADAVGGAPATTRVASPAGQRPVAAAPSGAAPDGGYTTVGTAVLTVPVPAGSGYAAGPDPGDAPAPAAVPDTGVRRTRNGLAKRVPRAQRAPAARPDAAPRPQAPAPVFDEPLGERSPDDVRSMLSAFRGGHLRGEIAEFAGLSEPSGGIPPAAPPYDFPPATREEELP